MIYVINVVSVDDANSQFLVNRNPSHPLGYLLVAPQGVIISSRCTEIGEICFPLFTLPCTAYIYVVL